MAILLDIAPLNTATGSRVTLRFAGVADSRVTSLNDVRWWPGIISLPTLSMEGWDGDFSGSAIIASASFGIDPIALIKNDPAATGYRWADALVNIYEGEVGAAWGSWTLRFSGRIKDYSTDESGRYAFSASVDGEPFDANVLYQAYAGTGGIEGGADLKTKPKPMLFGRAQNVEPVLINAVDSVYQVHGYGSIAEISAVYERAASLVGNGGTNVGNFATLAELIAATIPAGSFGTCLALGLFRLGAPPAGVITCDVDGENGSGTFVRTTATIIARLSVMMGISSTRLDIDSLSALNAAVPYPINIYQTTQVKFIDLVQLLARPCNAQAIITWTGKLCVVRFGAIPSATTTLDAQGRAKPPVLSMQEVKTSSPYWRIEMRGTRCWRVHTKDEIAFADDLVDLGAYSGSTTYRAGNIVTLVDGSRWLYIATTPASGNAPVTGSAFWSAYSAPTIVDFASGVTGERKPADNATVGAILGGYTTGGGPALGNIKKPDGNYLGADEVVTSRGTAADTDKVAGRSATVVLSDILANTASIDQAQSDIAALTTTYGSTASAAASATAAATYATAAETARNQSQSARNAAQSARDLAQGYAATADTGAATATTQAGIATSAKNDAASSASASATSASQAASSATTAGQQATAAAASATSASTSASNASTFASQASTSATNAAGSASSAATQAGVATTAANNASSSASAASTSASSAASSASSAGSSASAAASSATNASTSAGNASTSAGQAATSATNALGSQNAAASSATVAANARDAALGYSNAAATSASSASSSATSAGNSATSATNSANTATAANGTAQTAATSATNSAATATAAAATATTMATLTSSFAASNLLQNGVFANPAWTTPVGTASLPPNWLLWNGDASVAYYGKGGAGRFGPTAFIIDRNGNQSGAYQDMWVGPGRYSLEIEVGLEGGTFGPAGVLAYYFTSDGSYNGQETINFGTDKPVGVSSVPTANGVYQYAKLLTAPANTNIIRIYLMAGWTGFAAVTGYLRTIWHKVVFRSATQAEIDGAQALINAATNTATITTNAATAASATSALAGRVTTIETAVNAGGTGLSATYARIVAEEGTRASADSALAARATTLETSVNDGTTGLSATRARLITEEGTRASADSALAARATSLEARAGATEASVSTQSGVIADLQKNAAAYMQTQVTAGTSTAFMVFKAQTSAPNAITLNNLGNTTVSGNTITKTSGGGAWNASAYSSQSYSGDVIATFQFTSGSDAICGLNSDPESSLSYTKMDYALEFVGGTAYLFQSGTYLSVSFAAKLTDVFSVERSGSNIYYRQNGQIRHTITGVSTSTALFFDSSLYNPSSGVYNITLSPPNSTSSVSIGAKDIGLYNEAAGGLYVRALSIAGGDVVIDGNLRVGSSIVLGNNTSSGWQVGLKPKQFLVADGTAISWTNPGSIPSYTFSPVGLPALGSGQTYNLYLENLTATGATARLKLSTPGTPTDYTLSWSGGGAYTSPNFVGTNTIYYINRTAAQPVNGVYTWTVNWTSTANVYNDGGTNTADHELDIALWGYNGAWFFIRNYQDFFTFYGMGSGTDTRTGSFTLSVTVPTGTDFFGVVRNNAGTATPSPSNAMSLAWSNTSTSSVSTASPSGERCVVTIIP